MKRFATPLAMLLLGLLVGAPTGFFSARQNAVNTVANPDTLTLTFPANYFADLPKVEDETQRLIEVDKFTFEIESNPGIGYDVVLPRGRLAEVTYAQR